MLRSGLLFLSILLFVFVPLDPLSASESLIDENDVQDEQESLPPFGMKRFGYDICYLLQAPARFEKKDWGKTLLIVGAVSTLYMAREDIREIALRNRTDARMRFFEDVRVTARGAFVPSLALLFLSSGKMRGNDYDIETAQILMESFAMSALATGVGSFLIAAERPEDGDDVKFFQTGGHGVSLDVALSSSFIFPLVDRYLRAKGNDSTGKKIGKHAGKIFLFSIPAFVSLQRMSADKHWAPDVFLGAFSGLAIGKILSNAHMRTVSSRLDISVSGGMLKLVF
ncbi:MAG: hypothetical protein AB1756_02535 [Acidobacteriota bacterium]